MAAVSPVWAHGGAVCRGWAGGGSGSSIVWGTRPKRDEVLQMGLLLNYPMFVFIS